MFVLLLVIITGGFKYVLKTNNYVFWVSVKDSHILSIRLFMYNFYTLIICLFININSLIICESMAYAE